MARKSNYGCASFLLDFLLIWLTCGYWIIWIIIRQWRARRP